PATAPANVARATLAGAVAGGAAGFWRNHGLCLPLAAWLAGLAAAWWGLALPGGPASWLGLAGAAAAAWWWWWLRPAGRARATYPVPLDHLFQGLLTLLGTVPRLVLLLALTMGPPLGPVQLLALLTLVTWPEPARLVRAQMLRVRELPFVEAARVAGVPAGRVWYRHALPHACRPLLATAPLSLARLIGLESTLAFLGIGRAPDIPSWGSLLSTLQQEPGAWWILISAGGALFLSLRALQQLAWQLARP
ncbi:MAG: ABC transporter permease, partial [Cytophagaceae bacterium]